MKKALSILLVMCCIVCELKAQIPAAAQHAYDHALRLEAKHKHEQACRTMEDAINLYPGFPNAYSTLGEWYFNEHLFAQSVSVFRKAFNSTNNGAKQFSFPLAKSLVYAGFADEALNYIPYSGDKNWDAIRKQANFIINHRGKAWNDTVFLLQRTNSPYAEIYPCISTDEQKIYFTRNVNGIDEDFFVAMKDSCGGWFKPKNLGSPPNTPDQEAAQMISADGHYLFFTKCENRTQNGWENGGCDLYMSYTADSVWSQPQSFGGTINSPAFEGMACLSPDNRELFFVSNRAGGYGGMDIWVSKFENGLWQLPRNLGPEINTAGDETAPFIHPDNYTLYFSSTGHEGFGGADFFMAKRKNDSVWTQVVNMGEPINSTADESSLCVNFSGTKIYFSSDRYNHAGNYDLYEMKMPVPLQPKQLVALKGYVYDSLTKERLNICSIYVREVYAGNLSYRFVSNRGDGSFMITLPTGKKYSWTTDRISYMNHEETFEYPKTLSGTIQEYNIPLLPDDYLAPINDSLIATFHFPKNVALLTPRDKQLLQQALAPFIQDSKGIMILVNGYTDNSGTPLINEQLSYVRADLVAKEIISLGWDEMQVQQKGWGEANPVAPNDDEDKSSRNRRVEVIIKR
jgi:outer membrane protein OmpA-like peptidoglycan-associated protein